MNTDKIIPVRKEHLLLMLVLFWLGPGVRILITGIQAMQQVKDACPERVWWLCLIAVAVAVAFSFMFNNFIKRYTARILTFCFLRLARLSAHPFHDGSGHQLEIRSWYAC